MNEEMKPELEGLNGKDLVDIVRAFHSIVDAIESGDLIPDAPGVNRDEIHALAHRLGWV